VAGCGWSASVGARVGGTGGDVGALLQALSTANSAATMIDHTAIF
jgi:hypothetical protein